MPKARSPERDQAYELYKNSKGLMPLREIARQLNVPEKSVSGWKCKDKWDDQINGVLHTKIKDKRSTPKSKRVVKALIDEVDENEELSEQEKLFVLYYLECFNAKQAYIQAGFKVNTDGSARVGACRLMKKPKVINEIKRLQALRKELLFANEADIIERLQRIAFADINHVVNISKNGREITMKSAEEIDGSLIESIGNDKFGIKIKMSDRMQALNLLFKYYGLDSMDKHKKSIDEAKLALERKIAEQKMPESKDGDNAPRVVVYLPDNGRKDSYNGDDGGDANAND